MEQGTSSLALGSQDADVPIWLKGLIIANEKTLSGHISSNMILDICWTVSSSVVWPVCLHLPEELFILQALTCICNHGYLWFSLDKYQPDCLDKTLFLWIFFLSFLSDSTTFLFLSSPSLRSPSHVGHKFSTFCHLKILLFDFAS